jgi:hypothetical protein
VADELSPFTHLVVGGEARSKPAILLSIVQGAVMVRPEYVFDSLKQKQFLASTAGYDPAATSEKSKQILAAQREWRSKGTLPFSGKLFVNLVPSEDTSAPFVEQLLELGGGRCVQPEAVGEHTIEAAIVNEKTSEKTKRAAKNYSLKLVKWSYILDYVLFCGRVEMNMYLEEA